MSNIKQTFFCEICGKNIFISQQNLHKLNCVPISKNNKKKSISQKSIKNNCKSNNINININIESYNIQQYALELRNPSSISSELFKDNNINSEEKLNDDGINITKNLNSNFNNNFGRIVNQLLTINNINENSRNISYFYSMDYNPVSQTMLDNLNVFRIKNINNLPNDGKKCSICLEEYKEADECVFLPCFHKYHSECIKTWLKKNNNCPICKSTLKANTIS